MCIAENVIFISHSLWQYVLQTLHKLFKSMFQEMETEIKYKYLNNPKYTVTINPVNNAVKCS